MNQMARVDRLQEYGLELVLVEANVWKFLFVVWVDQ